MIKLTELLREVIQENVGPSEKLILWHGTPDEKISISRLSFGMYTHTDVRVCLDYARRGTQSVYKIILKPTAKIKDLSDPEDFFEWCRNSGILEDFSYEVPASEIDDYDPDCILEKLPFEPDPDDDDEEQMYSVISIDVVDKLKSGQIFQDDPHAQNGITRTAYGQKYDVLVMPDWVGHATDNFVYVILKKSCIQSYKKYHADDITEMGVDNFLSKHGS
jgi:hypothetical protein